MKHTVLLSIIIENCGERRFCKVDDQTHPLTEFQLKVLKATIKIPFGETRSYQWVAEQIAQPKAVRAVGQALRRNPYPIAVPCHRVIKSDGSFGGYAGGPSRRKEELLTLEQEILGRR